MKHFLVSLMILLAGGTGLLHAQGSARKLKAEGEEYFKHDKYQEALNFFLKYQRLKPSDLEVLYKIGLCHYYTNDLKDAQKFLTYVLENDKKIDPKTYYYLGRVYHSQYEFEKAIQFYKQYLKNTKVSNSDRGSVKDAILRCDSGMKIKYQEELAVVENMGSDVNTVDDDFYPVQSPNYDSKLYFSSRRKGNLGGLRNEAGLRDDRYGTHNADIYSTMIINGRWTATAPMSSLLNSPRHDLVLSFNQNGTVMYFFKGKNLYSGEVLTDTFSSEANDQPLFPANFVSSMRPEFGDHSPFFYNDSTLLFSSYRDGGYGGSDLYISMFRNGLWTKPANLGPMVNSVYDDTSPFLSLDGRTLYFSSNRTTSMGGLDIFSCTFDDEKRSWGAPYNMGHPINSPADDDHFSISPDGMKAYFDSSRKDGMGKRDLYTAYFKSVREDQQTESFPMVFTDVLGSQPADPFSFQEKMNETASESTTSFREADMTEVRIDPLYYNTDEDVLSSPNKRSLKNISQLMRDYPQLELLISSHSDETSLLHFDIFFSMKRAEKVADHLSELGVRPSRMHVKGTGPIYPVARPILESGPNTAGIRYNRRIDLILLNQQGLPLAINYRPPNVGNFADERGLYFQKATQGLSYKVQVATMPQMYNSELFTNFPDPMIESSPDRSTYYYTLGLYKTFSSAQQLQKELTRQGVINAFVIPYYNGRRISQNNATLLAAQYPDLVNYLQNPGQ